MLLIQAVLVDSRPFSRKYCVRETFFSVLLDSPRLCDRSKQELPLTLVFRVVSFFYAWNGRSTVTDESQSIRRTN